MRRIALTAIVCAVGFSLAGCVAPDSPTSAAAAGGDYVLTPDKVPADEDASIVVWADATRQEGLEAYAAAHPEANIDVQLIPLDQLLAKIQLANRAGSGWPDLVFVGDGTLPALASTQYDNFLQPLNGLVDQDILDGFGTSIDPCTIDDLLYCLRNDVAPDVMYYSTKGLEEVGAELPTTFEELDALVTDLAANHPDYKIQLHGSDFRAYFHLYNASQCPFATLDGLNDLTIDMTDPRCVRASELLDHMVSSGVLITDALSPEQLKAMGSKLLLTLNAAWRAGSIADMVGYEPGTLGVTTVPVWEGDEDNSGTGNEGGGSWAISRHAKNMKGAIDLALYMSTDPEWLNSTITFPAYEPARADWLATTLPANPALADPDAAAAAMLDSAARLSTVVPWLRFDAQREFPVQDVQAGKSIVDEVAQNYVYRLSNAATAAGYNVKFADQ